MIDISFKQFLIEKSISEDTTPRIKRKLVQVLQELQTQRFTDMVNYNNTNVRPEYNMYPVKTFEQLESDLLDWLDACIQAGETLYTSYMLTKLHEEWDAEDSDYHQKVRWLLQIQKSQYGQSIPRDNISFQKNLEYVGLE